MTDHSVKGAYSCVLQVYELTYTGMPPIKPADAGYHNHGQLPPARLYDYYKYNLHNHFLINSTAIYFHCHTLATGVTYNYSLLCDMQSQSPSSCVEAQSFYCDTNPATTP